MTVAVVVALLCASVAATNAQAVTLSPAATTAWLGPWEMPLGGVESIATSPLGDYVYVGVAGRVIQYSASGVWVRTWSTSFGNPSGLASDPHGDVYVADSQRGEVQKFDSNGAHIATWSVPGARRIATDTYGHVFILASVLLATVVDVRSYAGVDGGAWSPGLPGTWFPYTGYLAPSAGAVNAITTDAAGNVVVGGVASQRLDGSGPDCSGVFSLHPELRFEYDDPLRAGEIALFSPTGSATRYGWISRSSEACYPGWYSDGDPTGVAVAPDDGSIWVSQAEHFFRRMVTGYPPNLNQDALLEVPCPACNHPPGENYSRVGPEAFDCRGNLYVGAVDRVLEYYNLASFEDCPSRLSLLSTVVFAPALTFQPTKPKKKKGKQKLLSFVMGCLAGHCSVAVNATARIPSCHGHACTVTLAHRRFSLSGRGPHHLSLALSDTAAALLAGHPGLKLALGGRLLRHGKPFGPSFHPVGDALVAHTPTTLSMSCPAHGAVGAPLIVSGELAGATAGTIAVTDTSPAGVITVHSVALANGHSFALTITPGTSGTWTLDALFPGDSRHSPAGAGCSSDVPGAAPGPLRRPLSVPTALPVPLPEPIPIATALTLKCRAIHGAEEFTGTLTPALAEVAVTITYHYSFEGKPQTKTDTVATAGNGSFTDKGPPADADGNAAAAWSGNALYGASSASCEF